MKRLTRAMVVTTRYAPQTLYTLTKGHQFWSPLIYNVTDNDNLINGISEANQTTKSE